MSGVPGGVVGVAVPDEGGERVDVEENGVGVGGGVEGVFEAGEGGG